MKSSNSKIMEHPVDCHYRQIVLDFYMCGAVLGGSSECPIWLSACPFCSDAHRSPKKREKPCATLLWVPSRSTWKFVCSEDGAYGCRSELSFPTFLKKLNSAMGRQYLADRYGVLTAARGAYCPNSGRPAGVGRSPNFRSRTKPQNQRPQRPSKSNPGNGQIGDRPQP